MDLCFKNYKISKFTKEELDHIKIYIALKNEFILNVSD